MYSLKTRRWVLGLLVNGVGIRNCGNGHFSKCTFSTVSHPPSYNLTTASRMGKRKHHPYQQEFGKRMIFKKLDFYVLQWMVRLCIDGHIRTTLYASTLLHIRALNRCTIVSLLQNLANLVRNSTTMQLRSGLLTHTLLMNNCSLTDMQLATAMLHESVLKSTWMWW